MNFFASWVFRCPRWVYFKLKYPEMERINPKLKKVGDLGERIALEFLKEKYRLYSTRKRSLYCNGFRITGKPDFKVLRGNDFEIVEVKRVSKIARIPKKRWIAQLNLYLKMEGIENGFILEISRDKIRKSKWRYNQSLFDKSIEFYEKIYESIKGNEIPKGRVGECLNCSFKELCLSHR